MVKLVDAPDSKSGTRESVRVRFPPPALFLKEESSIAFAQFDDESSEDSYSYGASEETDDAFADNSNEEAETKVGEATASADEWQGFNYEEMGLTQWEFQQAKQEGLSRDKLTHLVEMGVRPSEYLRYFQR